MTGGATFSLDDEPGVDAATRALHLDPGAPVRVRRVRRTSRLVLGIVLLVAGLAAAVGGLVAKPAIDGALGIDSDFRHPLTLLLVPAGFAALIGLGMLVHGLVGQVRVEHATTGRPLRPLHARHLPHLDPAGLGALGARLATGDPRPLCRPAPGESSEATDDAAAGAHLRVWLDEPEARAYAGLAYVAPDGRTGTALPAVTIAGPALADLQHVAASGFDLRACSPALLQHLDARYGPSFR